MEDEKEDTEGARMLRQMAMDMDGLRVAMANLHKDVAKMRTTMEPVE